MHAGSGLLYQAGAGKNGQVGVVLQGRVHRDGPQGTTAANPGESRAGVAWVLVPILDSSYEYWFELLKMIGLANQSSRCYCTFG